MSRLPQTKKTIRDPNIAAPEAAIPMQKRTKVASRAVSSSLIFFWISDGYLMSDKLMLRPPFDNSFSMAAVGLKWYIDLGLVQLVL